MQTMKRRVVYLSDEDWTDLKAWAKSDGLTISETLRGTINIARARGSQPSFNSRPFTPVPKGK